MIKIGEYNTLRVMRKSDLGYMLTDGSDEVLLHFAQSLKEHKDDEEIEVFIYSDKAKRMTATEVRPLCTMEAPGFVRVVDVIPGTGVFVNINTPKDILISKDYLPFDEAMWPQVDDTLFIRLKERKGTLVGKPLNRFDIIGVHAKHEYAEREHTDGYVCRITDKGIGVITVDKMYVYVPLTQLRGKHRMGSMVNVCITKAMDEEYYGTLNAQKEEMIDSDKEIILGFLNNNHGTMPLTAKSSAEEVERLLKMSRKPFKRAYGGLYKEHIIDFDDNKTFLVK